MTGLLFGGIAIGPALSSVLIQATGTTLAAFYAVLGLHSVQVLYTVFIMPESLGKDKQAEAKRKAHQRKREKEDQARMHAWEMQGEGYPVIKRIADIVKRTLKPLTDIFAPIALLAPTRTSMGGLDWSLPLVALANALYSMMVVSQMDICLLFPLLNCRSANSLSIRSRCNTLN
jgi:hypothetical protein